MATSRFQQSDYKSNIDQTDGHLHVGSGSETLKTAEQNDYNFRTLVLLENILLELKIMRTYLELVTDEKINEQDTLC